MPNRPLNCCKLALGIAIGVLVGGSIVLAICWYLMLRADGML